MSKYVTDTDMGYKDLKKNLAALNKRYVVVGVLESTMHKDKATGKMKSLVPIAIANEYGVPSQRIPARPFIRSAIAQNKELLKNRMDVLYGKILSGDYTTDKALQIIGEYAQQLIQRRITEIRTPPNAASTIAKKGSSKPLIDSGQLRASIRWKLESR